MSDDYQLTIISGHLGSNPELRYTAEGKPVCSFPVYVNEFYKDTEYTTKYKLVVWGKYAETLAGRLEKGQKVTVLDGRVSTEAWNDKVSGEAKSGLVLTASKVKPGPKSKGGVAGTEPEEMPF